MRRADRQLLMLSSHAALPAATVPHVSVTQCITGAASSRGEMYSGKEQQSSQSRAGWIGKSHFRDRHSQALAWVKI